MIATAAKLRKFATNDVNMKRTPSTERRLSISAFSVDDLVVALLDRRIRETDADGCVEPPSRASSTATGGGLSTSYVTWMSAHESTAESRITPTQR